MHMSKTLTAAAALALGIAAGPASFAWADTPADTLVIADKIDDIVSLDRRSRSSSRVTIS